MRIPGATYLLVLDILAVVFTIPIGHVIRVWHLPTRHLNLYQLVAIKDNEGKVTPPDMEEVLVESFFNHPYPALYVVRVNYDYNGERYVPIDYNYFNSLEILPLRLYKQEWIITEEVREPCVVAEKVI